MHGGFHTALGLLDPVLWFTSAADAISGHIRGWHNLCGAVWWEPWNSVFAGHKGLQQACSSPSPSSLALDSSNLSIGSTFTSD
ncbi:hypothetical protein BDV27DRAFT_120670 [Aspergillus caelatus]|uniref:Uncharacterized protein n=1 Tax=Aspergillus caelatus TaxID=61420 RepID=A0A5N7AHX1_9EURO|nr:uncharacterized protein BDV27DRAFT_120670 [Aspergillus caelatus]KAE8369462.1 hypothetical protein BDV27DRAFT_120670 [Aspergillus caelatus]